MTAKQTIEAGKAILGIEFGSTRIKAVMVSGPTLPRLYGMASRTATLIYAKMFRSSTTARSSHWPLSVSVL